MRWGSRWWPSPSEGSRTRSPESRRALASRQPHLRRGLDPRRIAPVAGREKRSLGLDVERRFGHFFVPEGADPRGLHADDGDPDLLHRALLGDSPFLGALGQSALVAPLAEMLRILSPTFPMWPRRSSASGWAAVVARILRQVVRNLLAGAGLDRAAERAGLAPATGGSRLSAPRGDDRLLS